MQINKYCLQYVIPIAIIIALGFAVYGNTLTGKFVWDDEYLIKYNAYVKSFSHLKGIFTQDIGYGSGRKFGFYRPVQMVTYIFDYTIGKFNEIIYHLTNIVLHVTAVLCLYWLVRIICGAGLIPLITCILFIVHPVHVAAVAYIAGRADSLALIFMMLSFVFYIKNLDRESVIGYAVVTLGYALALLSKEISLILPVLILLYHFSFKKKIKWAQFAALLAVTIIFIIARLTILRYILPGKDALQAQTTVFQRMPGFFAAMASYAKLLIVPFGLHMEYGTVLFKFNAPIVIIGMLIFAGIIAFAIIKRKASPILFFSFMWFAIAILPVSNLYPLNAYMAEHWLYLPSIGLFIAAAYGLNLLWGKEGKAFKIIAAAILLATTLFYSVLTIRQNGCWRGPIPFYEWTRIYAPNSIKVLNDLARQYEMINKNAEAEKLYMDALKLQPTFPLPYNNLGFLYQKLGNYQAAAAMYARAIELDPTYADALNNLGVVSQTMGRNEDAFTLYNRAIGANPNFAGAYSNLANLFVALGRESEAISAYEKAIKLDPQFLGAYHNLGLIYAKTGRREDAIKVFNKLAGMDPNNAPAHVNLAMLYYYGKEYDLAVKHCDIAIKLGFPVDPKFLEALKPYRK